MPCTNIIPYDLVSIIRYIINIPQTNKLICLILKNLIIFFKFVCIIEQIIEIMKPVKLIINIIYIIIE